MTKSAAGTLASTQARRLPDRARVILPDILRRHAGETPDAPCAFFENGDAWSWRNALAVSEASARVLHAHGMRAGDRIAIMLGNGPGFFRAWWGVASLGAVMVPLHTASRGPMLGQICRDAGVRLVITGADYEPMVRDAVPELTVLAVDDLGRPDDVNLSSSWQSDVAGRRQVAKVAGAGFAEPVLEMWHPHAINFTSGTTGPSKGAFTTWIQTYLGGCDIFGAGAGLVPADRWLVDLPLHHVAAQQITIAALSVGASVAVREVFTGSRYWQVARECGATRSLLAGGMGALLAAAPPSEHDTDHRLEVIAAAPMVPDPTAFMARFGLRDLMTAFGGTETGSPLIGSVQAGLAPGAAGRPRDGVELRVVDEHDIDLATGQIGELVIRSDTAWEFSVGYIAHPRASAHAWRNGWFHTGDAFRRDEAGWYYFIDRLADSIRRRGENVSSYEVERQAVAHPAVADAACVGVRTDLGDDEVKLFVVTEPGVTISYAELVEFLAERLPYFMVPRFIETIAELPRTATMKVRKVELRESATGTEWDREQAGIRVTRTGLIRP